VNNRTEPRFVNELSGEKGGESFQFLSRRLAFHKDLEMKRRSQIEKKSNRAVVRGRVDEFSRC